MSKSIGVLCRKCFDYQQFRFLSLQEHQSKQILRQNRCSVQNFFVISSWEEAKNKFDKTHFDEYVVKAQILAGGRGKGHILGMKNLSGIYITKSSTDALKSTYHMLNKHLVTNQTGKDGLLIKEVMVAESITILRETYLAILMDRESNGPLIVASPEGGMNIEEVAETKPHLILKEPIPIDVGISDAQCYKVAKFLKFSGPLLPLAVEQIRNLYNLFLKVDAIQIEINPFAEASGNQVYCVDAKLNFDDNAAFRQKEIFALENGQEHDVRELEAQKHKLNYIGLDGNIACLVNGAGLAMATMDLIKFFGGSPANFLDVGGTVTEDQVLQAFRILTMDPQVKAILVNIFGGIVNCATIANGLLKAFEKIQLKVPLIVRLEGTNVMEARKLIHQSHLPIHIAANFDEAAKIAVEQAKAKNNNKSFPHSLNNNQNEEKKINQAC